MTLEETFNDARELKARVTCWGPYEIDPSRWSRVQSQLAVLNSGHLRWQALDLCGRQQGTSINCIHAVADLEYSKGQLKTKRTFGTGASRLVTAHLRSWVISHGPQHDCCSVISRHMAADLSGNRCHARTKCTWNMNELPARTSIYSAATRTAQLHRLRSSYSDVDADTQRLEISVRETDTSSLPGHLVTMVTE